MLIGRLVASGRFHTPDEAVGAGLRKRQGEEGIPLAFESFPEGSLTRFFTPENNSEKREFPNNQVSRPIETDIKHMRCLVIPFFNPPGQCQRKLCIDDKVQAACKTA